MSDLDDEDTWTDTTQLPTKRVQSPAPSQAHFVLKQMNGPGAPKSFQINLPEVIIGRGVEADIHVDAPDLSREHVRLSRTNEECSVKDLKSRNGCYLNGVKIHSATLRNGDTLQLGRILFSFHEG